MTEFSTRYRKLNTKQKQAVDHIDGPLLVIAGPGTGKTELLSMRAAQILTKTDTLPSNILCLTFTDSGAAAMRSRLGDIIGPDAYKVAIHTFHSFGSEIISHHPEQFYRGGEFKPADELTQYELLRGIFDELDYTNPLAGKNGDTYTHLGDTLSVISELKRSGLTSDELLAVLEANEAALDALEPQITQVFSNRISKSTVHLLAPLAELAANTPQPPLPASITPYANVAALSIAHAIDEAVEADSTKPITAWKAAWCTKDDQGNTVLKDRARIAKLRAVSHIYYQYLTRMTAAGLYDYDDMILDVIHAIETHPELRHQLAETFQYIMVDEFQDTNLAQLRLLFAITAPGEQPNVMAVGDDDQAIYSFQGADVGNIQRFRTQYGDPPIVVLTDNYRSGAPILAAARQVITQGSDRLEATTKDLSKQLTPHAMHAQPTVTLGAYANPDAERHAVAEQVKQLIGKGESPENIAILARRHHELQAMVPALQAAGILVNYERRDNALEHDIVRLVEHLLLIIDAIHREDLDEADSLLPEIISHPAFGYSPHDIWKLSLASYRTHQLWLEIMQTIPVFKPFADWLIVRAAAIHVEPLEVQIDAVLGVVPSRSMEYGVGSMGGSAKSDPRHLSSPALTPSPDDSPETHAGDETVPSGQASETSAAPLFPDDDQEITGAKPSRREGGALATEQPEPFISPLYTYFFSPEKLQHQPDAYLDTLEALRTIRDRLREHYGHEQPTVAGFLEFLASHRELGATLTTIRRRGDHVAGMINLMSVHKSKGLEFQHVFIIGAVDSMWGQRVRSRSRLISYPANLPLAPSGDTFDERLRLFFVAMTRAKAHLHISYSVVDTADKPLLPASFLSGTELTPQSHDTPATLATLVAQTELDWRGALTRPVTPDMRTLLAPTLETYKLSSTHLSNFLDVTKGGPSYFLTTNLLRFPQAKPAAASYGTAIHTLLQRAHTHIRAHGQPRPVEDLLADYERILGEQFLAEDEYEHYLSKGIDSLSAFFAQRYTSFNAGQKAEVSFGGQGVVVGDARLTGNLDLIDIDGQGKTIRVTDYKTGRASRDWRGRTEYEKIKLHKYRQQLMFYQLLVEGSRDYSKYSFDGGVLQFVEPTPSGDIVALEESFATDDLARFRHLIAAVWHCITTLELPDISDYEPTLKGIEAFEADLLDKYGGI